MVLLAASLSVRTACAALSFSPSGNTAQQTEFIETDVQLSGDSDFTWEAKIKPSAQGLAWSENRLLGQTDWKSEGRLILEIRKNAKDTGNVPKLALLYRLNGANKRLCGATQLDGSWVHVAVTRSGANLKIYLDGVLEAETSDYAGPLPTTGAVNGAGVFFGFGYAYSGSMSDVRVWNTARTPEEIAATMSATLAGTESGLVGYWPLTETYGAPVNKVGAKRAATPVGYNRTARSMYVWSGDGSTDWYVKTTGDDAAATADATGATYFKTIQAAIDASAAGDTVWVEPGVYADGETVSPTAQGGDGVSLNRLWIDRKITVASTGDRSDTFIVGRQVPEGHGGRLGPRAVRCLGFGNSAAGAVVRGFTLKGGATQYDSSLASTACRGGGACSFGDVKSWLVDCTIEDCAAVQGGGLYKIKAARCLIRNNWTGTPHSVFCSGAAARESYLVWCVLTGNGGAGGVCVYPNGIFHCTFAGNQLKALHYTAKTTFYGCIFDDFFEDRADVTFSGCATYANATKIGIAGGTVVGEKRLIAAPLLGDARLLSGSSALGISSVADAKAKIEEAYLDLDFERKPVSLVEGELHPGACQHPVEPKGGLIELRSTSAARTGVDGCMVPASHTNYVWAMSYPTQYLFRAEAVNAAQAVRNADNWFDGNPIYTPVLPLDANDSCWISAPPTGHDSAYSASASAISYIDRNASYEGDADGTAGKPFRSFAEAIRGKLNFSYASQVFVVKPGVYDNDDMTSEKLGYRARVVMPDYVNARFVAEAGPEQTVIAGASDPDTEGTGECGCGPNAVRVTGQENNGPFVTFSGFTLAGGRANCKSTDEDVSQPANYGVVSRAIIGNYNWGRWMFNDCIVSNNVSPQNLIVGGSYARCRIADNRVLTAAASASPNNLAVARQAYFLSCVFSGNESSDGVSRVSTLAHCTIDATGFVPYRDGTVYNCISVSDDRTATYVKCLGSIVCGCGTTGGSRLNADPQFADAASGDYRIFQTSPAVGLGRTDAEENWWRFTGGDFNGNRIRFLPDGTSVAGARQDLLAAAWVTSAQDRGVAPIGRVPAGADGSVTVEATEAGTRNLLGFAVDGVLQAASGTTFTYAIPASSVAAPVISAVYSTNWYANAGAPDDSQNGGSASAPKRTLAAALTYAIAGDVVHAAPGTYDEGSALHGKFVTAATDNAITVASRAVVPDGVTLVATGGREVTFISGQAATRDADGYGCGPDAVRCAYLGAGARLHGFTLTGGRTGRIEASYDDRSAAGVLAGAASAEIADCTISNCVAPRTAAGWGGTYRRCRVVGNLASSFNSALRDARVLGCYVDGNTGSQPMYSMRLVKHSTLGPRNCGFDGGPTALLQGCYEDGEIADCLFGHSRVFSNERANRFVRCVIPSDHNIDTAKSTVDESCILSDPSLLVFDGDRGPALANPAVDAGDSDAWADVVGGETDANGGQRVYNGRMDVGAVEADWRPEYAARLSGSRRFSVVGASGEVVGRDGRVFLPSGSLSATYAKADDGRTVEVECRMEVTGNGTLAVSVNGEAVRQLQAGTHVVSLACDRGINAVVWTYAAGEGDTGGAWLAGFRPNLGTVLVVR